MFTLFETTDYPKIGLSGEHLDAFIISRKAEIIKDDLEGISLDCISGAITQLLSDETADLIIEKIKEILYENVPTYDEDSDSFFVEKIDLHGLSYLNIMFIDDLYENTKIAKLLKEHNIKYYFYGAEYNDYDPLYALKDFYNENPNDTELCDLISSMETWLKSNVPLKTTDPNEWCDDSDYSLSYARHIVEHGIDC